MYVSTQVVEFDVVGVSIPFRLAWTSSSLSPDAHITIVSGGPYPK